MVEETGVCAKKVAFIHDNCNNIEHGQFLHGCAGHTLYLCVRKQFQEEIAFTVSLLAVVTFLRKIIFNMVYRAPTASNYEAIHQSLK